MKKPFLQKIAAEIVANYKPSSFDDIILILPNKRASIFLKKYLADLINQPVVLPEIVGMDEFIERQSGLIRADQLTLIITLYEIYNQKFPDTEFDEFLSIGSLFLSDFNDVDRYMVTPDDIYKNIYDLKAIDVWKLNLENPTELEEQYLKFWEYLPEIYSDYRTILLEKKIGYQGLIYREVAEKKLALNVTKQPVFCGFNALSQAEEEIIRQLQEHKNALIYWDIDKHYVNNPIQEAGLFIRKHLENLEQTKNNIKWLDDLLNKQDKNVTEISVNGNVAQTKILTRLLNNPELNNEKTVIVLADEKLLLPTLSALPEKIKNVNITMGFPLKELPISAFVFKYIQLFKLSQISGDARFYYKDFFALLDESFFAVWLKNKFNINISEIKQKISENKHYYFSLQELQSVLQDLALPTEFYDLFNISQFTDLINNILSVIISKRTFLDNDNLLDKIELEAIFEWNKLLVNLKKTTLTYNYFDTYSSLHYLLSQMLNHYKLDFYGEPLTGIQIMGMLETRNLDFENVILMSANEGVLPQGNKGNSFIPFEVKKHFGLPTSYEQDAIFAYHFYRLLQYPEFVTLVYNVEKDEFGSGEKSRFIHQINNDLRNISISENTVVFNSQSTNKNNLGIQKNKIINLFQDYLFNKEISPSAISTYLNCPLDFYFKYLLKLRETDKFEEGIEANELGTVIHNTLQELYTPLINKILLENDISNLIKIAPQVLQENFEKEKIDISYGENKLTYEIALQMILNFLNKELHLVKGNELIIKELESKYSSSFSFKNKAVKLIGKIDRIDTLNGALRVIDYKTGNSNGIKIDDKTNEYKDYAFQLMFYRKLIKDNLNNVENPITGIIFLKKSSPDFTEMKEEYINDDAFNNQLNRVFTEMLDVNLRLEHNTDSKYCLFCEQ